MTTPVSRQTYYHCRIGTSKECDVIAVKMQQQRCRTPSSAIDQRCRAIHPVLDAAKKQPKKQPHPQQSRYKHFLYLLYRGTAICYKMLGCCIRFGILEKNLIGLLIRSFSRVPKRKLHPSRCRLRTMTCHSARTPIQPSLHDQLVSMIASAMLILFQSNAINRSN